MEMQEIISHSEQETAEFAAKFATTVEPGTVIALHGSLGAGKTVFARGFARGFGVESHIPSPTFTIVQEYPINLKAEVQQWLFHMDLYRIADSGAALAFGIDEYLNDVNAIKVIEWSERIADILPDSTRNVYLEHINENERKIILRK